MSQPQLVENPKELLIDIPVELVYRDPNQPRKHFMEEDLKVLADSIDVDGQAIRVMVRPHPDKTGCYMLVWGERRWRAISLYCTKTKTIRAILTHDVVNDRKAFKLSFLENLHRRDLFPLEIAESFRELMEKDGLNQSGVARMIGKEPGVVSQHLSLLRLTPEVQAFLDPAIPEKRRMGFSVAVAISRLDPDDQLEMAEFAMERGRRFHDVEDRINFLMDEKGVERPRKAKRGHATLSTALKRLTRVMETRFNTVESVLASYYRHGHVHVDDIVDTIDLANELARKLILFASRLVEVKNKIEARPERLRTRH